jgi:hypothetical protein
MAAKIRDTYFRRVFVPIVLAVLVLAAIAVILYATPGAEQEMMGGAASNFVNMVGGALRRLNKK